MHNTVLIMITILALACGTAAPDQGVENMMIGNIEEIQVRPVSPDRHFEIKWDAPRDTLLRLVILSLDNHEQVHDLMTSETNMHERIIHTVDTLKIIYNTGEAAQALKGHAQLSYRQTFTLADGSCRIAITEMHLDGIPPVDPRCWIPCPVMNEKDTKEHKARSIHEVIKWEQLAQRSYRHLDERGNYYLNRFVDHKMPPANARVIEVSQQ